MEKFRLCCLLFSVFPALLPAQVQVSQEPRHHKVLDNTHVRLLDVHILPGDTSQFHIHATPSVFVVLNSVKTGSEVIIEEDRSKSPVQHYGNIYFEGFYKQSRIHRVWNSDLSEFHVMDIELPNKNYISIDPPIRNEAFTFLFEEKPVRAYRLTMEAGSKISLPARKADILMILLSDSADQVCTGGKGTKGRYFFKKGDYGYLSGGIPVEIKNEGAGETVFALFELK